MHWTRLAAGASVMVLALAACNGSGDNSSANQEVVTKTVTATPPTQQEQLNQYAPVSAAPAGVNALAGAPADPSTGDQAEEQFAIYVFQKVVSFWRDTEGIQPNPDVTFQTVDTSNPTTSCVDSDKNSEGYGTASTIPAAKGPYYCQDNGNGVKVIYWPTASVFDINGTTLPSLGSFAEAYAIAHEYGH
jgi:predicted metalloprotease